jgi:glutathione reductase (NADPH)
MARFTGPDTVKVDGRVLKGRNIVVAAGACPVALDLPGAEHA